MMPAQLDLDRPVTELARVDYVQLFDDETVARSVERIRTAAAGDRIAYFYATNRRDQLVGVVAARRLLLADPAASLRAAITPGVITVPETATLRDALHVLSARRLMAVPIVDEHNHLNGVIDLKHYTADAVDAERRESAETLFQLLGVHIETPRAGVWSQFRGRFPWLLCNLASGLIAAAITGGFSAVLQKTVALAFFFPVVMGIAESVAMLAVTLSVQHVHHAGLSFPREFRMGPILGAAAGILVALAGISTLASKELAGVLWLSVTLGACFGTGLGLAIPRLIHRWKLDPKIAAGPAVLALTDIATLTSYLALASLVLQ